MDMGVSLLMWGSLCLMQPSLCSCGRFVAYVGVSVSVDVGVSLSLLCCGI